MDNRKRGEGRVMIGNVMEISAMKERLLSVRLTNRITDDELTLVLCLFFPVVRYFTSA